MRQDSATVAEIPPYLYQCLNSATVAETNHNGNFVDYVLTINVILTH